MTMLSFLFFFSSHLGTKEREATQEHEDYRGQWMVTQSCNTSKKHKVLCRQ